jgi:hypothetical protein
MGDHGLKSRKYPDIPSWHVRNRYRHPVVGHFDFSLLKSTSHEDQTVELVDVGGGTGAPLKQILDKHPELDPKKCVLQDRLEMIEMAKGGELLPEGVVKQGHDFMTEQPVKGAKAYFMRMIMHDYADPVCMVILSQLAKVTSPEPRVLICEMVLPHRVGEADFASAALDQALMTMGGKERTGAGFKGLFESAGLELTQVWRVPVSVGLQGSCILILDPDRFDLTVGGRQRLFSWTRTTL